MMQKKVQQQYFTRDREGVFRTSEGFDTVAKSPSLDPTFIKSVLHPYCVYKAPQELLTRGETNEALFPESFLVFHADNGELVIGRSIYIGADFTGQRSASFTHQYVVPKDGKEPFVREPNRLFRIRGFQSSYDIREGKSLPELDAVDYDPGYEEADQEKLLAELGIDAQLFQQLVYAVMSSVTNKRKVYIALDTDISASAAKAKALLEVIYRCIPYAIRRLLGFMTFNSEPESKHNVHVVFVEKGSLRLPDRRIDKDYIFDFPNKRFLNTELPASECVYFETVWNWRQDQEQLRQLFDFFELALAGLGGQVAQAVAVYCQLAELYAIEQGDEALYEANRTGTMQGILTYLTAETAERKERLKDLFIRLLRKEASDGGGQPAADYVGSLLDYYAFAGQGEKALLIQCFVVFIHRASSIKGEGMERSVAIYDQLIQRDSVFGLVMKALHKQSAPTAEQYIVYRMNKVSSVEGLQKETDFWLTHAGELVLVRFFSNEVLKKIKLLLQARDAQKRIELISTLFRYFDQVPDRYGKREYDDFIGQLKLEIQLELLGELELNQLRYEDAIRLRFMVDPIDPELLQNMNKSSRQSLILLGILYRMLTLEPGEEAEALEAFQSLGPMELDKVQETLQRLLADRLDAGRFRALTYAFYQPDADPDRGYAASVYNYDRMLEYIAANTAGTGLMYDFLLWSAEDDRFLDAKGDMNPNYRAAVAKYFDRHDPAAFRQKPVREQLLATGNASFAALFQTIKLKQSPAWVRLLVKNKRKLIRSGLIALPVFVLLLVVLWNPIGNWLASFGPPPEIAVEALPETATAMNLALKAAVKGEAAETGKVQLFLNGKYMGNGAMNTTVMLHDGENVFEFKAVNRGGTSSEVVTKKVTYNMPAPVVKHGAIPDTSKTGSVTITATATDPNDPSPAIFINGQQVGQGSVSYALALVPGDNPVEIKAGNKYGKSSETIKKTIKYTAAVSTSSTSVPKR
ncbi:cadherin-like beta sandwich domain-containing protein [Paenibacillus rigui]|uniref:Uncharacterized protein n=1 Tax=Paenibacillus rigui TaxID=554312 RepID=A0A229UK19_9BACL|nr:cadherin-like beta sandwich domain-containing protein [Paenibacillus rigui]OXM83742.1 hypothetical protein CF651_24440 [Paenibacillus rigui]